VLRVCLKNWRNQLPFCLVTWAGPGDYAGAPLGSALEVFPIKGGAEKAQALRATYIGHYEELGALLRDLQERGGYQFNESPLG
jgi:hypothetical protein